MSFALPWRLGAMGLAALATSLAVGAAALGVHRADPSQDATIARAEGASARPEARDRSAAGPSARPAGGPRAVVVLATEPSGSRSELFAVPIGDKAVPPPFASLTHGKGATARGALVDDDRVAVVADADGPRAVPFGAALTVADARGSVRELARGVVHASAPLVTASGALLVSRGDASATAPDGTAPLTIDRVDPSTAAVETLFAMRGHLLYLAGSIDDRALVYAIDADGRASLLEVPDGGGPPRALLSELPPFARDFVVDDTTRTLTFVDRDEHDSARWEVLSLDLDSGFLEAVASGDSMLLVPALLPDGSLAIYDAKSARERDLGGAEIALPAPGVLRVARAVTDDDPAVVAGIVTEPGHFGRPIAFAAGTAIRIPAPEGRRVAVLGTIALRPGAR